MDKLIPLISKMELASSLNTKSWWQDKKRAST